MGVSVNMVLECLAECGAAVVSSLRMPTTSFSRVLPAADVREGALDGVILVGSTDDLSLWGDVSDETLFVCAWREEAELLAPGDVPANAIVVCGIDKFETIRRLSCMIMELAEWDAHLVDCVLGEASCTQLACLGHEMLGRPLLVLSPDFEVLGSAGIHGEESALADLAEGGCGDPRAVFELIIPANEGVSFGGGQCASAAPATPIAHAYAKHGGRSVALVLMDCSRRPLSASGKDLLDRFASRVAIRLRASRSIGGRRVGLSEELEMNIRFLLDGRGTELESSEMERRVAAALDGALEGCWVFVLEGAANLPPEFLIERVSSEARGAICLLHEGRIVGVASRSVWKKLQEGHGGKDVQTIDALPLDANIGSAFEILEPMAQNLGVSCGLSSPTVLSCHLDIAYAQALQALAVGERLCQSLNPFNSFRLAERDVTAVRSYDELYLHVLCDAFSRVAPLESICHSELVHIMELDRENGTDNYRVLYVLLENSMKIGEAAKILFMHRNNVRYRVNKIVEQFGLDLDSATERLRLRVTFRALDLLHERRPPAAQSFPISGIVGGTHLL